MHKSSWEAGFYFIFIWGRGGGGVKAAAKNEEIAEKV